MAIPSWPDALYGHIIKDGFAETPPENTVRSEMSAGPAKLRRRTTSMPRTFNISIFLKSSNLTVFDDFFHGTLKSGSLRFNLKNPRTQDDDEFRFIGNPKYVPHDKGYEVSFQLEQMP